jgi:sec-independent protein translocase protein TatA
MGLGSGFHWIVLLVVVLLLFGSRLPSVMRSLGRGVTEFKKGIEGAGDDDEAPKAEKKPEGEKK